MLVNETECSARVVGHRAYGKCQLNQNSYPLLRLKMNRAAELLLGSGQLIKQVAEQLGFTDLYRLFAGLQIGVSRLARAIPESRPSFWSPIEKKNMKSRLRVAVACVYLSVGLLSVLGVGLDREPEAREVPCAPADGSKVICNPPAFVWLPVAGAKNYVLQVSRSREFPAGATIQRECAICIEVPRQTLEVGSWFWRCGVVTARDAGLVFGRVRAFEVPANVASVPFPAVRKVVQRLSAMRPRLVLRPGDAETFRAQARGEMAWAMEPVLKSAQAAVGRPLMPEPPPLPRPGDPKRGVAIKTSYFQFRKVTDHMDVCAEAYLLSGERRFGEEARRLLMHVIGWNPNGSTSFAGYDGFATHIVRACSRTYDYVYPLLTDAERAKCREVLAVRMAQLYRALREIPFECSPFRSHTMGFYVPDLTEACIAMAGELPVEEMLEYCLLQFWSPYYPPFGGEDGGWTDGPYYWGWYWNVYARLCAMIERATGAALGERPLTRNAWQYKLYGNPPYSRMSPFGDGQSFPADRPQTMFVLGAWLRNPYALWYAEQLKTRPSGLTAFLFQPGDLKPRAPDDLPQARCFRDAGLVAMHSVLADGARDVQVLLRSCPLGSISHGYADQNAFVLHAFGEPLAISSGYYDLANSPHQRAWTRLTKAANCITVDGAGQPVQDAGARGRITAFASNDYAHYALGDAHAAYAERLERFDRHVLYLRPHAGDEAMVIVADELASPKPAKFEWWLHALEKMEVDDAHASVTIQRGAARLRVQFLAPAKLRLEQTGKFPIEPNEAVRSKNYPDQWHLTAHADEPATRREFLTVLLPYRAGAEGALPAVRVIEGRNCRAVELQTAQGRHVVMFRSDEEAGAMEAGELRSDAKIFAACVASGGQRTGSLEVR